MSETEAKNILENNTNEDDLYYQLLNIIKVSIVKTMWCSIQSEKLRKRRSSLETDLSLCKNSVYKRRSISNQGVRGVGGQKDHPINRTARIMKLLRKKLNSYLLS